MDHEQLNVLVIDDDADTRELLGDIIRGANHQVVPAASAEEGLELLPYWTFQVAFIDQRLPGMEGLVLGEYLRGNNPDMTIALVTGAEDTRALRRQLEDLSIAFVPKPFIIGDILGLIDAYAEGARARRELRLRREDPAFHPSFGAELGDIAAAFAVPSVPARVESAVVEAIKRCLNNLRSVGRYTERDRGIALTGLLTALALGLDLPKTSSGLTLFEEYDRLMREHGRRVEFEGAPRSSSVP